MHTLRAATEGDILAVARFQTAAWGDAYRNIVPRDYLERTTIEARADRWGDRIRGGRTVTLAEEDGRLDGVVSTSIRTDELPGPSMELASLYVAAAFRGSGLGSLLLKHALGATPAVLWVFEQNLRAIAFYRARGFDLEDYRTEDPDTGLNLVRMARSMSDARVATGQDDT